MRIVEKPWGHEEIWAQCDEYVGKLLFIKAGCRLSRQYHIEKRESVRLLSGQMTLECGLPDDPNSYYRDVSSGECFDIPPGLVHRFCAVTDVVLIEVSTNHLDDVARIEDDHGRA